MKDKWLESEFFSKKYANNNVIKARDIAYKYGVIL